MTLQQPRLYDSGPASLADTLAPLLLPDPSYYDAVFSFAFAFAVASTWNGPTTAPNCHSAPLQLVQNWPPLPVYTIQLDLPGIPLAFLHFQAIYGVAQSRTRLKQLSSSSSTTFKADLPLHTPLWKYDYM